MKDSMNLNILIFEVLLGMIIVLMSKSGGSAAYGRWAGSKIRSKKSAMLATTGLGMLIFVDDYFNCLTVTPINRELYTSLVTSASMIARRGGTSDHHVPIKIDVSIFQIIPLLCLYFVSLF